MYSIDFSAGNIKRVNSHNKVRKFLVYYSNKIIEKPEDTTFFPYVADSYREAEKYIDDAISVKEPNYDFWQIVEIDVLETK